MEFDPDERARLRAFETLLDGSKDALEPWVEMTALRKLCGRGIPDHPRHLRPLAYSLLLGTLPPEKKEWRRRTKEQRDGYYSLVAKTMDELDAAPPPTDPRSATDKLLTQISKDVDRVHSRLSFLRIRSNPSSSSPLAPPPEDTASASDSSDVDRSYGIIKAAQNEVYAESPDRLAASASKSGPVPPTSPGLKRGQKVERIMSRRAALVRLELLAEAEHRRQFSQLDKGKARSLGERQGDASAQEPEIGVTNMSPRITLSPDVAEDSTSSFPSIMSTLSTSGRAPPPAPLSLSIPPTQPSSSLSTTSQPHSPITLVSPKVLTAPQVPSPTPLPGSLLQPDSHGEILLRLIYVFCRSHPEIAYSPSLLDILIPLYLIFAEADMAAVVPRKVSRKANPPTSLGGGKHAEEEAYCALVALATEFGPVVFSPSSPPLGIQSRDVTWALEKLGRRVRWADEQYWTALRQRNLDPGSPLYAYQWITLLLTNVAGPSLAPVWDFIFSEPPATQLTHAKVDLLVDICVAMLFLVKDMILTPPRPPAKARSQARSSISPRGKGASLWGDLSDGEEEEAPPPPTEDMDAAFVRGLQLLRDYPLNQVGGIEALLQSAFELRQSRVVAGLSGDDPDSPGWSDARDAKYNRTSWASERLKQATQSSLASTSKLFSSYAETFQQSDTAASISRASTNWTASAMARWADASNPVAGQVAPVSPRAVGGGSDAGAPATPTTPGKDWKSLGATAGKWWGSIRSPTQPRDDESVSGDEEGDTTSPAPSPSRSTKRDSYAAAFAMPKFISSSMSATAPGHPRERSDSTTSGFSISSVQDRLAHLTTTLTTATAAGVSAAAASMNESAALAASPSSQGTGSGGMSRTVSGPRPLLLSDKVRRASNASASSHHAPSPSRPPSSQGGSMSNRTPPGMQHRRERSTESDFSASDAPNTGGNRSSGLYRIGSRSTAGTPRTPAAPRSAGVRGKSESEYASDSVSRAARRLHDATSGTDTEPGGVDRTSGLASPARAYGSRSNGDSATPSQSPYRQHRRELTASSESEFEQPSGLPPSPYGRRGTPRGISRINGVPQDINTNGRVSELVRKYSSDSLYTSASTSAASGTSLSRGKIVTKKFQKRPTSLRLDSMDSSANDSESGIREIVTAPPHAAEFTSILSGPLSAPPGSMQPPPPPVSPSLTPTEPLSIPTPQIAHLTEDDYEHIYEPAEDSFILLDALEADALVLRGLQPSLCVEIGSGSGIASTFLDSAIGSGKAFVLSTDINAYAASATLRTGTANKVQLNPVLCNLLDPLVGRLEGKVDVLIFNPPYVETEETEMTITQRSRGIGGAWAGGEAGMGVTNLVLEQVPALLSPGGRFYLVAIQQNKPDEIVSRMTAKGLECKVVLKRRAGRELLSVIRMIRPFPPPRRGLLPATRSSYGNGNGGGLSIPSPLFEESDRSPTTPRASAWPGSGGHQSVMSSGSGSGTGTGLDSGKGLGKGGDVGPMGPRSPRSPRRSKGSSPARGTSAGEGKGVVPGTESEEADDEDDGVVQ